MTTLPFSRIADRYDLANRILSFGLDILWRKTLLREIKALNPSPNRFLDIACGSGDILRFAKDFFPKGVKFFGLDPCGRMLNIAQRRVGKYCCLVRGRAENLPFKGGVFEVVTVAFGVRNFEDRRGGLREIFRTLKRGGILGILEFSPPSNGNPLEHLGWCYTKRVVPLLGGVITGDRGAYDYLASSVERFPTYTEFLRELEEIGFKPVKVRRFIPSPAVLYVVRKP
ncbi:MAG TPA: ubiquinone/menaquinone biosynthesis methyltransferase [Aquifex sp.]|nr:ubiquinone/menaquinone biosynthesis methyltransferase [Aquifex sp.]